MPPPAAARVRTGRTGRAGERRDGPRERLQGVGPGALSDAELVALILRTGERGERDRGALAIAQTLLGGQLGLHGLARASLAALQRTPGIGAAKAASLAAAFELGRRHAARRLEPGHTIRGPEDVHAHFWPSLRDARRESFRALLLDGRHRVISEHTASVGTLTASLVHPREVFRPAVEQAAAAVVLVHNHPSGDAAPSAEDEEVTRRLARAGELVGIRVVDHVIVAERGYYSFREAGVLEPEPRGPAGE